MLNHRLGLQSYIWKKHRTSATIYFGQMRPKLKCLQKPNKVYQHKQLKLTFSQSGGRGMFFGLWCSWGPYSHRVDHKFLSIPEYSRVKCEAVCPMTKARPKLGHATLPWSQAQLQQQLYDRMAEKQKNQSVSMTKSDFNPNWQMLKTAVQKQIVQNSKDWNIIATRYGSTIWWINGCV